MNHLRKIVKVLSFFILLLVGRQIPCLAQTVQQGALLLSPDTDCVLVFDGEDLGHFSGSDVRKLKADFGEHLLMATFSDDVVLKKVINIKTTSQMVIKISPPKHVAEKKQTIADVEPDYKNDTLSKDSATQFYKAELGKQSPVNIKKLKYYLSKGADVKATEIHGWSLLHEAAYQGDTDLILYCLQNGLPVNGISMNAYNFATPLSCAIDENHPRAAEFLLRKNGGYGISDGYKEIKYDSGNSYKGYIKNGKRDGQGTFYYSNGAVAEVEWVKDNKNGKGSMSWPSGSKFEGEFLNDKESGQGTYTFGQYTKFNGDRYIGHFYASEFSGRGVYYYADGGRYEGSFLGNVRNGQGTMVYSDSTKYVGNWSNGKRNGQGLIYYPNGNGYSGNWEGDKREGWGVFLWAGGDKYEGNWVSDYRTGRGTYSFVGGSKYTGDFVNNQMTGQCVYYYAGGNRYEGGIELGKRSGKGTFYWINGDKYEGSFVNDGRDGYGVYTANIGFVENCDNCKIYKGDWKSNKKNGYGRCFDSSGKVIYEGKFVDDKPGADYPAH